MRTAGVMCVFLSTILDVSVFAGTVYEANSGDDIETMIATLAPGDTLVLHGGVYNCGMVRIIGVQGTSSAWITIRAADGETPILDGQWGPVNVLDIDSSAYIQIEGLEIRYADDGIKFSLNPSHHFIIEDCYIHDVASVGVNAQTSDTGYVEVIRCEIANCGSCGCYWGRPDGVSPMHHSRLAQCYVHDCGNSTTGYGIEIKMPGYANVIEDNVFHHVAGSSRAGIAVYYTDRGDADDNIVRRNVIWNVPRYSNSTTTPGIWSCSDARVENNIVFNSGMGFHTNIYGGHIIQDLKVINNTFYNCASQGLYMAPATNCIAYNNAVYGCVIETDATWTCGGNLESMSSAGVFESTTFGNANFLYPAASGPLVDTGDAGHYPADDFNGLARPHGSYPDVGAYEYMGTPNPGWTISGGQKPPPGTEYLAPTVSVAFMKFTAVASDNMSLGPQFWIDGTEYPMVGGTFNSQFLAVIDGQTFVLSVKDASGNTRVVDLTVDIH